MSTLQDIVRIDITATEEADLVALVRTTETAQVADPETGLPVTRYFPTREQDDALQTLIAAYISDIRKAARTAKKIDRDDAEMVALEKFINLARAEGRTNERLAGFVSRAMVNAVMDADAENSAVRIPPDTLRRYFNLVKECGSVDAAYEKCKNEANNFDPITLLAVNRAINAESVEALQAASGDQDGSPANEIPSGLLVHGQGSLDSATSSHEEAIVQADLVRWLLAQVTEVQADICRLAYGFIDTRTENLRLQHGYQWDALLSDAQIAPVVAHSRAKVQRERTNALRTMREAMNTVLDA